VGAELSDARDPAGTLGAALRGEDAAARLHALVASDVIGVIEGDGEVITGANDAFLVLLGYTREELESGALRWNDLTPPGWEAADEAGVAQLVERGACVPFEKEYRSRDGTKVPVLVGGAALSRDPLRWLFFVLDLTERKRAEEAQQLLAAAGEVLGASLDYRTTLQSVADLAAAGLADWCVVQLLEEGSIRTVAVAHRDPAKVADVRRLEQRYPPELRAGSPSAHVVGTGRPLLLPEIPDELVEQAARDAEHGAALRRLGLRSAIVVPLDAGAGVIGLLTLVSAETGRRFGAAELAVAEELARRSALAIERAALHDGERRARRLAEVALARANRLQQLTAALAEALTRSQVARVLVREGVGALGADAGAVFLLDETGEELELVAQRGYPSHFAGELGRVPIAADAGAAFAVRANMPRWYGSTDEYVEHHPGLAGFYRSLGYEAVAFLPLTTGRRAIGAVAFSFRRQRAFPDEEREHLIALAGQCAQALERARLYEREHAIADTLQRSLLPERLPDLDGCDLAARYLAGSAGLEVGGDWYDALRIPDGRVVLCVGDVVGRGLDAAATMGQLRNAVRAFALEGLRPCEALARLSTLVDTVEQGRLTTIVYAVFDPQRAELAFASAGHPPPLLVVADGTATYLEGGRSTPLGAVDDERRAEQVVALEPGATFLVYTDGLIERRDRPLEDGLALLAAAAEDGPDDLDALLDHVLARLAGIEQTSDDVAILALRALPVAATLRLKVEASPVALASARRELRAWLEGAGADGEEIHDIVLACGEALTNAIEHPLAPRERAIEVTGEVADGGVAIAVRDFGVWREPSPTPERGRGLVLVDALMDGVGIDRRANGTTVTMRRRLRREPPVPA
jgi:PAS domain S-box-containing protein